MTYAILCPMCGGTRGEYKAFCVNDPNSGVSIGAQATSEKVLVENARKWAQFELNKPNPPCHECGESAGAHLRFCPNDPNAENKYSAKSYIGWAETKYNNERIVSAKALENPFMLLDKLDYLHKRIDDLERELENANARIKNLE